MPACLLLSVLFCAYGTSPGDGVSSEATAAFVALAAESSELRGGSAGRCYFDESVGELE